MGLKYKHTTILIPFSSILADIITVGDYSFYYRPGTSDPVSCATCLRLLEVVPTNPSQPGKITRLEIIKDCDCPPQK